ncbi:hypothetical protein GCM10023340_36510 [Nocardioides marinquilinus]|uniref:Uncharacterized protein n=1 Tax=Nocardioides marinquilinus TaxID=1210400 RepID=A0ABP9PXI0_9ACTN
MSDQRLWARHFLDEWLARSGDPRMPYWLRVTALAYGSHANNGHARFKRGEIALVLGGVDEHGRVRPHANVGREIDRAVEYGWLELGSYWGCLIVPAHSVRKGEMFAKPAPCPLAEKHKRERANSSVSERLRVVSSTSGERFAHERAHSVSGSERAGLSSDLSPTRQPEAS